MLGKIENSMPRSKMTVERLSVFTINLIEYITKQHTEVLHPTYKEKTMKTAMGRGRGRGTGKKPPKR
jgi:hypothetical protein